eukprot:SAG11_NODE_259_length_11534_cov_3.402361_12_plen_62_part_00
MRETVFGIKLGRGFRPLEDLVISISSGHGQTSTFGGKSPTNGQTNGQPVRHVVSQAYPSGR